MEEDFVALTKVRSLLVILIATCEQTLLTLEAAADVLDSDLTEDLRNMIERSSNELSVLTGRLNAARA